MKSKNNGNNFIPIILIILIVGLTYLGLNIGKDNTYTNKDNVEEIIEDDSNNENNNSSNNNNNNNNINNNQNKNSNNSNNNSNNNNSNNNNSNNNKNKVTVQFILNGSKESSIVVGSKWSDPGFKAIGSNGKDYSSKVTKKGSVNTNKVGTYTITYTLNLDNNSKTLTRTVKVIEKTNTKVVNVKEIKLSKSSIKLEKGKEITITSTITPSNATNKTIKWTTDNKNVATVKNGVIKAVGSGKATITAETNNGKKATVTVTVPSSSNDIAVSKIYLSTDSINTDMDYTSIVLKNGESITFKAVISPSNATNKSVVWSSSNISVATVKNGKITAVGVGDATITVKANNGKSTTISVKVTNKNPIADDGTINNSVFGIVKNASDDSDAEKTSRGITAAINYAGQHGIKKVKLSKGTYNCKLVQYQEFGKGTIQNGENNQSCVHITQSNITFDLDGSTIKMLTTNLPKSRVIYIGQAENVKVTNGTIIGDYKTHRCKKGGTWNINNGGCPNDDSSIKSHGSLHGIQIHDSRNITITKMNIKEFPGDGILVIYSHKCNKTTLCSTKEGERTYKFYKTNNINVTNNEISTTGRNAISIISGENVTISKNTFHDGKYGVCIEPTNDYYKSFGTPVKGVTITGNTMYNYTRKNKTIYLHRSSSVKITSNKLSSVISFYAISNEYKGYKSVDEIQKEVSISNNSLYKSQKKYLNNTLLNKHCVNCRDNLIYEPAWIQFDNKYYYVGSNQQFYTNGTYTIEGKNYTFDSSGVCTKGEGC